VGRRGDEAEERRIELLSMYLPRVTHRQTYYLSLSGCSPYGPHTTSQKRRARHLRVCRSLKIFAKIDPKDTVDKLNKSKFTGNVNVIKMVLPLVSCWW